MDIIIFFVNLSHCFIKKILRMKKYIFLAILVFAAIVGATWFYTLHEDTFDKMRELPNQYVVLYSSDDESAEPLEVEDAETEKPIINENGDTVKLQMYDVIFVDKYSYDGYYYFTDWYGELTSEAGKQMRAPVNRRFSTETGAIIEGASIAKDIIVKGLSGESKIRLQKGDCLVNFETWHSVTDPKTNLSNSYREFCSTVIPNNEKHARIRSTFSSIDQKFIALDPIETSDLSDNEVESRLPLKDRIYFWLHHKTGGHVRQFYMCVFTLLIWFMCMSGKWFDTGSAGTGEMLLNTFIILLFTGLLSYYVFTEVRQFWFLDPDCVGWIKALLYLIPFIFIVMCLIASLCRTQKCFNNKIGANKSYIFGWGIIILFITGAIACLAFPEGMLVYSFGLVLNLLLLFRMIYHGIKGDWGINILETLCWTLTFICLAFILGLIITFVASLVIKLIAWTLLFLFVGQAIANGSSYYSDVSSDQLYPMGYSAVCSLCPHFNKQGNEGVGFGHCKQHDIICNEDMTCGWNVEHQKTALYKQHLDYLEMEQVRKETERKHQEEINKGASRNYKKKW